MKNILAMAVKARPLEPITSATIGYIVIAIGLCFTDFAQVSIGMLIGFILLYQHNRRHLAEQNRQYAKIDYILDSTDARSAEQKQMFKDLAWCQRERAKHQSMIMSYTGDNALRYDIAFDIYDVLGMSGFPHNPDAALPNTPMLQDIENRLIQLNDPLLIKLWNKGTFRAICDLLSHLELRGLKSDYLLWNTQDYFKHHYGMELEP